MYVHDDDLKDEVLNWVNSILGMLYIILPKRIFSKNNAKVRFSRETTKGNNRKMRYFYQKNCFKEFYKFCCYYFSILVEFYIGCFSQAFIDGVNVIQDFVSAQFGCGAGDEMRRKFLPTAFEFFQVAADIPLNVLTRNLVCFREDDGKGNAILSEELEELKVLLLGLMAYVNQDKKAGELIAVEHIVADEIP